MDVLNKIETQGIQNKSLEIKNIVGLNNELQNLNAQILLEQNSNQKIFDRILACLEKDINSIEDLYNKYNKLIVWFQLSIFVTYCTILGILLLLVCRQ